MVFLCLGCKRKRSCEVPSRVRSTGRTHGTHSSTWRKSYPWNTPLIVGHIMLRCLQRVCTNLLTQIWSFLSRIVRKPLLCHLCEVCLVPSQAESGMTFQLKLMTWCDGALENSGMLFFWVYRYNFFTHWKIALTRTPQEKKAWVY